MSTSLVRVAIVASLASTLQMPQLLQTPPPAPARASSACSYVVVNRRHDSYYWHHSQERGLPDSSRTSVGIGGTPSVPHLSHHGARANAQPDEIFTTAIQPPPLPAPAVKVPSGFRRLPPVDAPSSTIATFGPSTIANLDSTVQLLLAPPPPARADIFDDCLLTLPFALRSKLGKRACKRPAIAHKRNRPSPVALRELLLSA